MSPQIKSCPWCGISSNTKNWNHQDNSISGWSEEELQIIKLALEIMREECGEQDMEITDLIRKVKDMQMPLPSAPEVEE